MRFSGGIAALFAYQSIVLPIRVISYTPRQLRTTPKTTNHEEAHYSNGRQWIDCFGNEVENPESPENAIKVVSYNVLGPWHGESSKHNYAPVHITKWTRRRDRLLEELREIKADIFCLQEVSEKGLAETFIPGLARIGLQCSGFAPGKTHSSSRGVARGHGHGHGHGHGRGHDRSGRHTRGRLGHRNIGCAMFSNPQKVEVLSSKRVHLKDFAPLNRCRSQQFSLDVLSKWNSMVMMLVRLKATNQIAVIANTHLFWDPSREDIKIIQTYAAADALSRFAAEAGYTGDNLPPLVFCGDFNSLATQPLVMEQQQQQQPQAQQVQGQDGFTAASYETDVASAMFEILKSGKLAASHPHHPDQWYQLLSGDLGENPQLGDLDIDWRMDNAYTLPEFSQQVPLFTTKTDDFQGWIDHIWVNSKVQVNMVMQPPIAKSELDAGLKSNKFQPMPNKLFASDHIPLGIIAEIVDPNSTSSSSSNSSSSGSTGIGSSSTSSSSNSSNNSSSGSNGSSIT